MASGLITSWQIGGETWKQRTGLKLGKEYCQDRILSPCLFSLYVEYITWNAGLDEPQAGINIAKRNVNNLIYADDTTLMAESEEKLKNLLMKVKEESEKDGLKLNFQETRIMAPGPITSWQTVGENMEIVTNFIFLGSKSTSESQRWIVAEYMLIILALEV